jgi:hypothetical protein
VVKRFAGTPYDDQIAEPLVEDQLDRHPGVNAADHGGERMLSLAHGNSPGNALVEVLVAVGDEAGIAVQQSLQRLVAVDNRRRTWRVRPCDRLGVRARVRARFRAGV